MKEKILVDRNFVVAVDSLLSCLMYRHGSYIERVGEMEEVKYLANKARDYTEEDKNAKDWS